jgi:single-strand DNA-binding protein
MSNTFSGLVRIVADAEIKTVGANNTPLLSVRLVNNVGFGDNQKPVWIRGILWGNRATEKVANSLTKGTQIYISGELSTNEYEKDGVTRMSLELRINFFDFTAKKSDSNEPLSAGSAKEPTTFDDFDDIPF